MASKELVDEYLNELGNYLRMVLNKHFEQCGGEHNFFSSLVNIPTPDGYCESLKYAVEDLDELYQKFSDQFDIYLNFAGLEKDFDRIYNFHITFELENERGDVEIIDVTLTLDKFEFDPVSIEFLSDKVDDEKLKNKLQEMQMEMWKFDFKPTQ
jgi:hypothetical protein